MLQSNVLLYNITHDKKYLQRAEGIAASATKFFYKKNKLLCPLVGYIIFHIFTTIKCLKNERILRDARPLEYTFYEFDIWIFGTGPARGLADFFEVCKTTISIAPSPFNYIASVGLY